MISKNVKFTRNEVLNFFLVFCGASFASWRSSRMALLICCGFFITKNTQPKMVKPYKDFLISHSQGPVKKKKKPSVVATCLDV